jgi:hypothetical protein
VDQAVELAEFRADGACQRVVFNRRRERQIQSGDGRLRRAEGLNLIIDTLQLGAIAAREDHGGAGARAFDCKRAPESAAGAGNQDVASLKQRAFGKEIFWDQIRHRDLSMGAARRRPRQQHILQTRRLKA